jgi:hypothetical protein
MASIEDRLVKSVVIVGETESTDYCIGLVALVTKDETFVLTQSFFVQDKRDRIKVSFLTKLSCRLRLLESRGGFAC